MLRFDDRTRTFSLSIGGVVLSPWHVSLEANGQTWSGSDATVPHSRGGTGCRGAHARVRNGLLRPHGDRGQRRAGHARTGVIPAGGAVAPGRAPGSDGGAV